MNLLEAQYKLVQSSREVLLNYCCSIEQPDFIKEHTTFGPGSIRNLLVHIANTYEQWIGIHALEKNMQLTRYEPVHTAVDAIELFQHTDQLMQEFFRVIDSRIMEPKELRFNDHTRFIDGLTFFSHVITHEFHHKGQIMSLSRHLGYLPVDADILR
ncbi:DinB family protein [Pedobacter sp. SAFR-022]|uniref:DinB family protein n=1 Tax=Pedobacter sp. SAFR-022 TaxID=3436861 RepID=UPI003F7D8C9C